MIATWAVAREWPEKSWSEWDFNPNLCSAGIGLASWAIRPTGRWILIGSTIITVKIIFTKIIPFFTFENNTYFYFTGTIIVKDALRRFQELKSTLGRIPQQWKGERLLSLRYLLFQCSHWLVGILKMFWGMQCCGISFILLVELKWLVYFTYSAWWLRKNLPGQRMIISTWNRKETWMCLP